MSYVWRSVAFVPVCGLIVLLAGALGQSDKEKFKPDQGMFEVRLTDGSTVKMQILTEQLEVATRYGSLKIPIAEVKRIEVGFRYPKGVEQKVQSAVDRLGDADFRTREAAAAELLALKELAYPAVKRAVRSDDQEVKRRAADIVRQFEEKIPAERLRQRDHDVIVTTHFPIAGRIEGLAFKGKSSVFGEVHVQLAETRQVKSLGDGVEVDVTVDATQYSAPSNDRWLETEVEVEKGTVLKIRAGGLLNLNPNGGNFQCGPDGSNQFGQNGPYPCGALIGRIGKNGRQFVLGARFDGEASESGRLYLRIAPSPWGNVSAGNYEVKVTTDTWGGFMPGGGEGGRTTKATTLPPPRFKNGEKKEEK